MDASDFTLVLREKRGVGITFNHVKYEVYKPGYEAVEGELTDRLELPAHCELHLAFSSTGITDPLWTITLAGKDERGQPVTLTIDLAVSPEPSRVDLSAEDTGTRFPLPSAPTIRAPESPIAQGLLAGLTIEERLRLQVVTASVNLTDFTRLLASGEGRTMVPLGAMVSFDPRVPPALRRGLRNVAASLIPGTLESNSTITLALDLSAYGGSPGAYRFTHSVRDPQPGRCARDVLIELMSPGPDAAHDAPLTDEVAPRLARHRFRIGPGWSEGEGHALAAVLDRIPDHWLAQIEGLRFNRARVHPTEPDQAGEYVSDSHAITMFDKAFIVSMTRFGTASEIAGGDAAHSIAHEIGHSFDFIPLRRADHRYRLAVAELDRAFALYETSPGSGQYQIPPDQKSAWDERMRETTALRRDIESAGPRRALAGNSGLTLASSKSSRGRRPAAPSASSASSRQWTARCVSLNTPRKIGLSTSQSASPSTS